jgi:hypothetical protein
LPCGEIGERASKKPLIAEYGAMEFVARLIDQGRLPRGVVVFEGLRQNASRNLKKIWP